jgi:phage terminase large subunit-like protein
LEDIPGALWHRQQLEDCRIDPKSVPALKRVIVAIDPAVTTGESADETGIIVAGRGMDGKGYVLADLSGKLSPDGWARTAIGAYKSWSADRIVAEVNNGGDLVEATLRAVDPSVAFQKVRASRGKIVRAEPIAALYEQGRIYHAGHLDQLEDQQCTFTPDKIADHSPDRVDACVWALSELFLNDSTPGYLGFLQLELERVMRRRSGQAPIGSKLSG